MLERITPPLAVPEKYLLAPQEQTEQTSHPILVITDDGRDVDDIEALAYICGSPNGYAAAVVTSHMIPDRRALIVFALLNNLQKFDVPIGVGSTYPVAEGDEKLIKYLESHRVPGYSTYEGLGMIPTFPSGVDVIHQAVEKYGERLQIAVLAPGTDLAKAIEQEPELMRRVGGIYIQGQALVERGRLVPDPAAYNLAQDMAAAETIFGLQDEVLAFCLVGKHAAYQVPFTRSDFTGFRKTGNRAGKYLDIHARAGLKSFAERDPETFERVFKVKVEDIAMLDELSKPYDALVAKAILNPEGLAARRIGQKALIGMTAQEHGIADAAAVKQDLIDAIHQALRYRQWRMRALDAVVHGAMRLLRIPSYATSLDEVKF